MKRRIPRGKSNGNLNDKRQRKLCSVMVKGSLAEHLTAPLDNLSINLPARSKNESRFQKLLDSETLPPSAGSLPFESEAGVACEDDNGSILSQDFFCTPDYITPEMPAENIDSDWNKENVQCPPSPEKIKSVRRKRLKLASTSPHEWEDFSNQKEDMMTEKKEASTTPEEWEDLSSITEDTKTERKDELQTKHSFVSQSAVALRCRVMPPPCLRNPYLKNTPESDADPFGNQRSKCAGFTPAVIGDDGLSRYRTDFHEIMKIGNGNFSDVYKVLKRIDGCMYAVKRSMRQLHQDMERRKALMEVQSLAALGSHENIVGYYSSWFENSHLYIQLELCDHSLCINRTSKLSKGEVFEATHQIAKALQYIHDRGVAHLDVKPDNIYVKNGVYKLGDFGCATLLDKSLPIEEGDARYMPQEILNDNFDNLDKVDIFALGVASYELLRGSALPESGPHFRNLREGKLPLLPSRSLKFQNLLKAMIDPDPTRRPSAKEIVENPIFDLLLKK